MILTGLAKTEAKVLLTFLTEEEVISLAQTVTNHQIQVETFNEAADAILTYSQTVEELLKRKKMKRETLFRYLASHKIAVDPTGEKHTFINEILKFWKENEVVVNGTSTVAAPTSTQQESEARVPPSHMSVTTADGSYQFAKEFARWFYEMLNSCNPSYQNGQNGDSFTNHHFYSDCSMKLLTKTGDVQQEYLAGGDTVHLRLRSFPHDENVLFVPNLEIGGVEQKMNPHGLVLVHVCGTIHRWSSVLGIFEQRFGLVRDPSMQFNWRVKFTNLCIQTGEGFGIPKLGMGLAQMLPSS